MGKEITSTMCGKIKNKSLCEMKYILVRIIPNWSA